VDDGDGRDGIADGTHSFVELVFGLVGADDGPRSTVVDHLLVRLLGTRRCLELDDALLREAEVHALGVLHVEGALVQLGDGIVGVEDGHLFVHFADDEPRQGHARHAAHQLHRAAVVDVPVAHRELFRLGLRIVQ